MSDDFQYSGMALLHGSSHTVEDVCKRLHWNDYDIVNKVSIARYEYVDTEYGVAIPRAFASTLKANDPKLDLAFEFSEGYAITTPVLPELREHQEAPVQELIDEFDNCNDVVLEAYTGSGKTVMGVYVAAEMGRTTLIIVDQNRLKKQWIRTLVDLFGYKEKDIGIVQGKEHNWDGYDFVIAMVQSLYGRDMTEDFYHYFGTVLFDEFDAVGAQQYSNVFRKLPAINRLSMSATNRTDSRKKVVAWHVEESRVKLRSGHLQSQVRYIEYRGDIPSYYANRSMRDGRYVSELAGDGERNRFIIEHLKVLYASGRNILVIGARIYHLECLHALAVMEGIPKDEMLLYTGSENIWKWRKDKQPAGTPYGWDEESEYTPVIYSLKDKKVKLGERDEYLDTARIVFATYSSFKKGVDVPELDTGFDVTPKANFVQIHGRILRPFGGKLIPIWVTIRDIDSFRAEYQFSKRLVDFKKSNAEVYKWVLHKGLKKKDESLLAKEVVAHSERLKGVRILTGEGGRNLLQAGN